MPPQKLHILGLDRKRGLFLLASPFKPVPGELTLWRKAEGEKASCPKQAGAPAAERETRHAEGPPGDNARRPFVSYGELRQIS